MNRCFACQNLLNTTVLKLANPKIMSYTGLTRVCTREQLLTKDSKNELLEQHNFHEIKQINV